MIQQRLSLSSMIAAAAAVVTLGLPGIASAAYEHPANNEKGVIVHPEHFKSEKRESRSLQKPRLLCSKDDTLTAKATSRCAHPMQVLARHVSK